MTTHKRPAARLSPIDSCILALSVMLGVWVSAVGPTYLEEVLGLGSTQAEFARERAFFARERKGLNQELQAESTIARLIQWRLLMVHWVDHMLPVVTLGAAAATFRHRTFRTHRGLRGIGVLTTAVSSLLISVSIANEFVLRRFPALQHGYSHNAFDFLWFDLCSDVSVAVVAAWTVLAVGRRWRSVPEWSDRLGRALGFAWVLFAVIAVLLQYALPISWV